MIFLRFPNEQTYLDAIAPYLDDDGNITIRDLSVIGIISVGGEYDDEGNVIEPPVQLEGYHVNALEIPAELEPYVIPEPNNPYRIYLGYKHE